MGHSRPLFLYFRLFYLIYNWWISFADVGIWTADLWCWKRPLFQLSHQHCPIVFLRSNYSLKCVLLNHKSSPNKEIFEWLTSIKNFKRMPFPLQGKKALKFLKFWRIKNFLEIQIWLKVFHNHKNNPGFRLKPNSPNIILRLFCLDAASETSA